MKKTIQIIRGKAFRNGVLFTLVAALALVGVSQFPVRAQSNGLGDDQKLEGSWDVTITQAGPFVGTPFRILRTITSSGVVDAYAFPAFTITPGVVNTSGHGNWKRTGNRLYSATVKYFQLNYAAVGVPPNVLDTVGTVRENITLSADGNSYTSVFLTTVTLPNGTVLLTNPGKTSAKRIPVDPLP
jgi:hypothetical protein